MSSDDQRVALEQLQQLIRVASVDELSRWEQSPTGGWDVGQQTVRDDRFGKLMLPIVHNGDVLYGERVVSGERIEPKDGRRVLVIDLTPLNWPRERAEAAGFGEWYGERDVQVDRTLLGEMATRIAEFDLSLMEDAGLDGDDIDELLASLEDDETMFPEDDSFGGGDRTVTCPNCQALVTV